MEMAQRQGQPTRRAKTAVSGSATAARRRRVLPPSTRSPARSISPRVKDCVRQRRAGSELGELLSPCQHTLWSYSEQSTHPFLAAMRRSTLVSLAAYAIGVFCLAAFCRIGVAATFVVTNTADSGPGTLRSALAEAQSSPGIDLISLSNVIGQIQLVSTLPPFGDTIIAGPGARQLTVVTPRNVIDVGQITAISGLRVSFGGTWYSGSVPQQGGIFCNFGTLKLFDCEFVSARAGLTEGGAIYSSGTLTINRSTFDQNSVSSQNAVPPWQPCVATAGGALAAHGPTYITNCTFTRNGVSSTWTGPPCAGSGGAIYATGENVYLFNCTFADNGAEYGAAISGLAEAHNCIITDSISGSLSAVSANNLITNIDRAGLGPLQDNGGPTLTCALTPNSPAINHGSNIDAPVEDQRGVYRPQAGTCDIGAFEFECSPDCFALQIVAPSHGTILRSPDVSLLPSNSIVLLTAYPDEDYALASWAGDASGQLNPIQIRMDSDKAITASFSYSPVTQTNLPGSTNYVFNTNAWGTGSFRQAIRDLNASGGGKIRFSNVTGTISTVSGLPPLLANFRIVGPGSSNLLVSIPASMSSFVVFPGVSGSISGLAIQSPWQTGVSNSGNLQLQDVWFSTCIGSNGGALFNEGTVRLESCLFLENAASSGGAVYNAGNLAALGTAFLSNGVSERFQSSAKGGGAVYSDRGTATFDGCVFRGNTSYGGSGSASTLGDINGNSGLGGAVRVGGGNVKFFNALFSYNSCSGGQGDTYELGHFSGSGGSALGAGIHIEAGQVTLTNCALVGNRCLAGSSPGATRYPGRGGRALGGAICAEGGILTACNCTFSGNEVVGGRTGGGGFYPIWPVGEDGFGGAMHLMSATGMLVNCTISGNHATGGDVTGNPGHGYGGGVSTITSYSTGSVQVVNTILWGNLGSTNSTQTSMPSDTYGPGTSLGHNMFGAAYDFATFSASDSIGIDPLLGPLQDNGGPAPTFALLAGSPAIDAGMPVSFQTDQRGQPRTIDNPEVANRNSSDGTDIGALEVNHILVLTEVSMNNQAALIEFTSVSDRRYSLQYKSDLLSAFWTVLQSNVLGSGGIVTVCDPAAVTNSHRFYRAFQQ